MALIVAQQRRGITRDITITDVDGNTITPGASDMLRAIICRIADLDGTVDAPTGAQLVVSSDAPTSNGSSFTPNSSSSGVNRLRLDAQDLTFTPGVYTLLIEYYDNADAEWKNVDRQVFVLEER